MIISLSKTSRDHTATVVKRERDTDASVASVLFLLYENVTRIFPGNQNIIWGLNPAFYALAKKKNLQYNFFFLWVSFLIHAKMYVYISQSFSLPPFFSLFSFCLFVVLSLSPSRLLFSSLVLPVFYSPLLSEFELTCSRTHIHKHVTAQDCRDRWC